MMPVMTPCRVYRSPNSGVDQGLLIRDYQAGLSTREVARKHGICRSHAGRILDRAGVIRNRSEAGCLHREKRKRRLMPFDHEVLKTMLNYRGNFDLRPKNIAKLMLNRKINYAHYLPELTRGLMQRIICSLERLEAHGLIYSVRANPARRWFLKTSTIIRAVWRTLMDPVEGGTFLTHQKTPPIDSEGVK